jgi:hypothetical protein
MGAERISGTEDRDGGAVGAERSLAALFTILWDALADLLGTAATAAIVHRAAQRAARRCPELGELVIKRESLDYAYHTPSAWKNGTSAPPVALRELIGELRPLLIDLTGPVVINHLARIPELREHGLVLAPEEQS